MKTVISAKEELKQGLDYAQILLKRVGIDLGAELMGEPVPTSLMIGHQAVIHREAAGEIRLRIYPIPLVLIQLKRMFGSVTEDEAKPPTPNIVPVEDIFDAVRRAVVGVISARVSWAGAEMAEIKGFKTDTDIVQVIPERARAVEAKPTLDLALPGFSVVSLPRTMQVAIAREDWSGAFPVFNIRTKIPVLKNFRLSGFVGDPRSENKYRNQYGEIPRVSGADAHNTYVPLFSQGVAKKGSDGEYDVWIFSFKKDWESIIHYGGVTEEVFRYYFSREIDDKTLIPIEARVITKEGWSFSHADAKASAGSLAALVAGDFDDSKVKLPVKYRTRFKNGEGLVLKVERTRMTAAAWVALLPLANGSTMRLLLAEHLKEVAAAGKLVDIPARVWDRRRSWQDATIQVSSEGVAIQFKSDYPEIAKMLEALGLQAEYRDALPEVFRLRQGGKQPSI